ncbi:Acyl-N-acyltransferase [Cordyceps militaris]|uniref:Acyl-N-acyltransferase n=1 Tax=Cordyceps militaris TaxID=73501 RepID=A0A2H4SK88_CORMI|nr:Acyl-N-acyltransferase [Cordyceps militaris]
MVELIFRLATMDDAPRLRALIEHAFSTNDPRPGWTGDAALASQYTMELEQMKADLAMPGVVTFAVLAAAGGDIIASVNVGRRGADTGRIGNLIVHDAYQRSGVGGQVLAYAEAYCQREWGVTSMSLNALSSRTALLAWYRSRGYRATGETSAFPRGAAAFAACVIPEDLCFIEMIKDVGVMESGETMVGE